MVELKNPEQIASMRAAGLVVAEMHRRCAEAAVPGASTGELDRVAAQVLADHGAKPNFLGYGGFPGNICTSVNDVVVHGIPSDDEVLRSGDLLSIDAGAIVDGWHADAAITVLVGEGHGPEVLELNRVTEESLWAGLAAMRLGNRLVDISRAVQDDVRRQPKPPSGKWGIVEEYGGHGIGSAMHMDPHVLNYVERRRGRGPKLVPGMCLAIEPMISLGTPRTHVLADDWTVKTDDGTWAAHWEHSIALTEQGPLVLTAPDGGRARLAALGVTTAPDPLA
ncbi:type I methionyl aminopeptidase [Streptomyces bohaiensis]|uniref:Methionine aminopeptidase n=1 Tax=Streptomyces bohaiensis TaxID=1431344 RepID=A0ABX1C9A3_9ACTN|nr:type I methionyl aminopeptidase [Streptomyces bohaiensis]NJQ14510.1 type I methionyl aminopeptidase [Streptomyces bohaiensis]